MGEVLTAIVIILYILVFLADFLRLPGGSVKERIVYCALAAVSLTALILYSLDIPVPSPADAIRSIIDAMHLV